MVEKQRSMVFALAFAALVLPDVARAQAPAPAGSAAPPSTGSFPQPAPDPSTPATPALPPPATLPPSPPPEPAPAPAPAPYAPPPGYMLVPIPQAPAHEPPLLRRELPYSEGQSIPPGYRVEERSRRGLIIAGSIVTGVPWTLSVTAAAGANFEDNTGFLLIPALGPWLMLAAGAAADEACENEFDLSCGDRSALRAILVLDGMIQTAGAVMFVSGLAFPSKRLVRDEPALGLVPLRLGRDGRGLGLVGSF